MSAYLVTKNHILFLIAAAQSRQINGNYGFSWYHNGETKKIDSHNEAEVAMMLWNENRNSVNARYRENEETPEITDKDFRYVEFDVYDPVQVIKSCHCLEYQSCEHDGWETSEAKAFLTRLVSSAIHSMPSYDKAEWGAPKTISEKRAAFRNSQVEATLFVLRNQ